MKKQKSPWSNSIVLLASAAVVMGLLVFTLFSSNYKLSSEGKFTKLAQCYDSDKGQEFYEKGAVIITSYENCDFGCRLVKEDECVEEGVKEYFCDSFYPEAYVSTISFCNCVDGRCV